MDTYKMITDDDEVISTSSLVGRGEETGQGAMPTSVVITASHRCHTNLCAGFLASGPRHCGAGLHLAPGGMITELETQKRSAFTNITSRI